MSMTLRVFLEHITQTKSIQFSPEMGIGEVLSLIREKTGIEGGNDFGIFSPVSPKESLPRWLKENQTLQAYNIENGDEIHYRNKIRQMKIKLLDGSARTIPIDLTKTVAQIADHIGEKMELDASEEYSLQAEPLVPNKTGVEQWLIPHKTIEEQGSGPETTLIYKKKYFFDTNVTLEDKVGLHLLFVQCTDAIVSGLHPISYAEMVNLGSIHAQFLEGKFDAEIHHPPFLPLKKIVPPAFLKKEYKTMEKDIIKEWRKLAGMTEQNAKYKYIQACRAIKTWGITTFPCGLLDKNNVKKKPKKLLLGITRDSLHFMNPDTKEIDRSWPLVKLRRWAAAEGSKSVTLDFGGYERDYLVLMTNEAEQITLLLNGYIDIIIKKMKKASKLRESVDTSEIVTEETILLKRTKAYCTNQNIFSVYVNPFAALQAGQPVNCKFLMSHFGNMAQIAYPTHIQSAMGRMGMFLEGIGAKDEATDSMTQQQWWGKFQSSLGTFKSSMEGLLNLSFPTKEQLEEASKLAAFSAQVTLEAAKNAALTGSEVNQGVLQAVKSVADSLKNIFSVNDLMARNQQSAEDLNEAQAVSHSAYRASLFFLEAAVKGQRADQPSVELIAEMGREAIQSIYNLLDGVKIYSDSLHSIQEALLNRLGSKLYVTNQLLGASTSSLAAGTILPEVKNHLKKTMETTKQQMEALIEAARAADGDYEALQSVLHLSKKVSDSISRLFLASNASESEGKEVPEELQSKMTLLRQFISEFRFKMGDRSSIVSGTRSVVGTVNGIIHATKEFVDTSDPSTRILFMKAKHLAQQISPFVNSSKGLMLNSDSEVIQKECNESLDSIEIAAQELVDEAFKTRSLVIIRAQSKRSLTATSQLINCSRSVTVLEVAHNVHLELRETSEQNLLKISKMLDLMVKSLQEPPSESTQQQFVSYAQEFLDPSLSFVVTSKKVQSKLLESERRNQMKIASDSLNQSILRLSEDCKYYSGIVGSADMDESLEHLESVSADVDATQFAVETGAMKGTGNKEEAMTPLMTSTKHLNEAIERLKKGAIQTPKQTPKIGREVAFAVSEAFLAIKGIIGSTPDKSVQLRMTRGSKQLVEETVEAMKAILSLFTSSQDPNKSSQSLLEICQKMSSTLSSLTAISRGFDSKIIDEVIKVITENSKKIRAEKASPLSRDRSSTLSNMMYNPSFSVSTPVLPTHRDRSSSVSGSFSVQISSDSVRVSELISNGKALSAAMLQIVTLAQSEPKGLGNAARTIAFIVPTIVDTANKVAGSCSVDRISTSVTDETRALLYKVIALLDAAKTNAANSTPSNEVLLSNALKEAQNGLSLLFRSVGYKEQNLDYKEAMESVNESIARIDDGEILSTERSLPESIQSLVQSIKNLSASTTKVATSSRSTPYQLGRASKNAATYLEEIVTKTKETLNSSSFISPEISSASKAIRTACKEITENPQDYNILIQRARAIGTATSRLISEAKKESSLDPSSKVLVAAQNVAVATSSLARASKAVQTEQPDAQELLLKAVQSLEIANVQMSKEAGRQEQTMIAPSDAKKLVGNVRNVTITVSQLLVSSLEFSNNLQDPILESDLDSSLKTTSESIAQLIRACSAMQPGASDFEEALEALNLASGEIDALFISVAVGTVEESKEEKKHQESLEEIAFLSKTLDLGISEVVNSTVLDSAELLGKACKNVGNVIVDLTKALYNAVQSTNDSILQNELITATKKMVLVLVPFLSNTRSLLNSGSKEVGRETQIQSKVVKDSIGYLVASMRMNNVLLRDLDETLSQLEKTLDSFNSQQLKSDKNYEDSRDDLNDAAKSLAFSVRKMLVIDRDNNVQIGNTAKAIGSHILELLTSSLSILAHVKEAGVRSSILSGIQKLTLASKSVVQIQRDGAQDRSLQIQENLTEQFKIVTTALSKLLEDVKQGTAGDWLPDEAIESINEIIADLEGASIFASAGQLESTGDCSGSSSDLQKSLLEHSKEFSNVCTELNNSTKLNREEFGRASKNLLDSLARFCSISKSMAAALSDSGTQQSLLTCAKAIAMNSQQLIGAGKDYQRFKGDETSTQTLSKSNQALAEAVQNITEVVQNYEMENAKGIEELNASRMELQKILDTFGALKGLTSNVKDLVETSRLFAAASAQLTASSNVGNVAEASKKVVERTRALTQKCKGAGAASGPENNARLCTSAQDILTSVIALMDALKNQKTFKNSQQQISDSSSSIADRLSELMNAIKCLPGGELEAFQDGNPEEIAARELRKAVRIVTEVSTNLANSRPKKKYGAAYDATAESRINAIVDASIAMSNAIQNLVQHSSRLQEERLQRQLKNPILYKQDPIWANGLIAASRQVASTSQQLARFTTAVANGTGNVEDLESVAKLVSTATAELVAASRAKEAEGSKSHSELSEFAKAVALMTNTLLNAVKNYAKNRDDELDQDLVDSNGGTTMKQLEQQIRIIRLEKELDKAKKSILDIRKGQ